MKVCSVSQTLKTGNDWFFGILLDLLRVIASGRATAHPSQDCESCSHVAQPVPTCGKHVVV